MATGVNTRVRAQMTHVAEITGARKGNGRTGIRRTGQDRKTDQRKTAREVRGSGRTTIGKLRKPGRNRGNRETVKVGKSEKSSQRKTEESVKVVLMCSDIGT